MITLKADFFTHLIPIPYHLLVSCTLEESSSIALAEEKVKFSKIALSLGDV